MEAFEKNGVICAPSIFPAGELQEVPRAVEAAQGEDVRAGAGAGRDPHEGAVVSLSLLYTFSSAEHRRSGLIADELNFVKNNQSISNFFNFPFKVSIFWPKL